MKAEEHELFHDTVSRAFDDGNYANAYETNDYDDAIERLALTLEKRCREELRDSYRAAFTLGFFGSYELSEMGEHADAYREAYAHPGGQECVRAGYCDAREASELESDGDWSFGGPLGEPESEET
jgi:hypothetical protein